MHYSLYPKKKKGEKMSCSLHLDTRKTNAINSAIDKQTNKIDLPDALIVKIFQIYLKDNNSKVDKHFLNLAAASSHHLQLATISMDLYLKTVNPKRHLKYTIFKP